jgi:hypothetical protein
VTALEHLSVLHDERAAVRGPRNRRDLRVVHQGKQLTAIFVRSLFSLRFGMFFVSPRN